jgi:transposase-like protein
MIFYLNQLPSETKIKKLLRKIIFGHNITCPACHGRKVYAYENRYRCRKCRRSFSLLSGTYLKCLKLSLRTIWSILWCYCQQIPVQQAMSLNNLSEQSVRHAYDLFRSQIPDKYDILSEKVQLDEAFFFGRQGKALMLAKQVGTRRLAYAVHSTTNLNRNHAAQFLFQNIEPRTRLQTDGGGIYKNINHWWPVKHKKDIHSKWEFSLTSEIEGMFGNYRTFIRRMYHHVTKDKFNDYVREFCLRFSSPEIFVSPNDYLTKTIKSVPFD